MGTDPIQVRLPPVESLPLIDLPRYSRSHVNILIKALSRTGSRRQNVTWSPIRFGVLAVGFQANFWTNQDARFAESHVILEKEIWGKEWSYLPTTPKTWKHKTWFYSRNSPVETDYDSRNSSLYILVMLVPPGRAHFVLFFCTEKHNYGLNITIWYLIKPNLTTQNSVRTHLTITAEIRLF